MATAVIMPRQGNTVDSCIIANWKKKAGDKITQGEVLCEVETDKALVEVDSPASGTLVAIFFQEGDEVPVLTTIAAIGAPDEDIESLRPSGIARSQTDAQPSPLPSSEALPPASISSSAQQRDDSQPEPIIATQGGLKISISPRARNLAAKQGIDFADLKGTGPGGRIVERDIRTALEKRPLMTPLAESMIAQGGYSMPAQGSGVRGRIMAGDLSAASAIATTPTQTADDAGPAADEIRTIPVKGIRKVIATRMLESLQTTAQLTLNSSANAGALLAYRERLRLSTEALGLQKVTVNDLLLFTVSRILPQFPELNATFKDDTIYQYRSVHLGFAVDTPRGLMVPVIRSANALSLKQIAQESKRLASACLDGTIAPDELSGGTFTVTNLGNLGIESFTPVLNNPQVGILGVGNVNLKPVEIDGEVKFVKHIGLSLTINHQVIDGAPAARFLQALAQGLADLELLLAM